MQTRVLGQTGLSIPPLVFGATSLGNLFKVVDDQEKSLMVQAWVQSGVAVPLIDSAGKYGAGLSLEVIGRELQRLDISPNDVLISNKLGWRRVPLVANEPTFEPGAWFGIEHDAVQDISYDGILRCYEDGNQLLGNYRPQLVSVHDPDEYLAAAADPSDRRRRLEDIQGAYRALWELRRSGEVAAVGVGAKDWRVIQELSEVCDLEWVMLANSLTIMHHPPELLNFIHQLANRQVGIINSALFHGGFLLGGNFFDYRRVEASDANDQQRLRWRTEFENVCRRHQISPFQAGVAFGSQIPGVTAVALSSSRADRIASHVEAVQGQVPDALWSELHQEGLIELDMHQL